MDKGRPSCALPKTNSSRSEQAGLRAGMTEPSFRKSGSDNIKPSRPGECTDGIKPRIVKSEKSMDDSTRDSPNIEEANPSQARQCGRTGNPKWRRSRTDAAGSSHVRDRTNDGDPTCVKSTRDT